MVPLLVTVTVFSVRKSMPSLPVATPAVTVGVAVMVPALITMPFCPGRTASSPTAEMVAPNRLVSVLLPVVMAAQSIAWPPAVTRMVPLLVNETLDPAVFTRKASVDTLLISPLLVTVRLAVPELLSMARPVPSVWRMPLLISVDTPVMVSGIAEPLAMLIAPVLVIVPVPADSVWAPTVVEMVGPAGANCANVGAATLRAPTTTTRRLDKRIFFRFPDLFWFAGAGAECERAVVTEPSNDPGLMKACSTMRLRRICSVGVTDQ